MTSPFPKLAPLADDPDAMRELVQIYLTAYTGGIFTSLYNVTADFVGGSDPMSAQRAADAQASALYLGMRPGA